VEVKMAKKRHYDSPTECPYCGREFKSPQGMLGHIRLGFCPVAGPGAAAPEPPPGKVYYHPPAGGEPSVRELEDEVKRLELQDRLARLRNIQQPRQPRTPDVAEQAGLGPMTEGIRQEVQQRAFTVSDRKEESWISTLLKNPQSMQTAINALRGILGVNPNQGGGDGVAEILSKMGYSIRELIEAKHAPRANSDLKVGGLSLAGVNLTPELLVALIGREDKLAELAVKQENTEKLMDGLSSLAKAVRESGFIEKIKGGGGGAGGAVGAKPGAGGGISAKPKESPQEEPTTLVCPECGSKIEYLPSQVQPGEIISCSNDECDAFWEVLDERQAKAEEKAKAKVAQEAAKKRDSERVTINCSCGQLIDITDRPIGSRVKCPVCGEESSIVSQTEAVQPAEVEAES